MSQYIDAFVLPIPRDKLENYRQMVEAVAVIWKEHGALDYLEYTGDDMQLDGTRTFMEALGTDDTDAIIFGWVVFDSRESRELANQRVATDPRMAKIMEGTDTGFDASRMLYGGFRPLVS